MWNEIEIGDFLARDIKEHYSVSELNEYLKIRVDKDRLSENYLDGHGYEIESNKTVFLIDKIPTVFDLDDSSYDKEKWLYRTRLSGKWIAWKDIPKHNSKMKARF